MKNFFLLLISISMIVLLTGCPGDNDDEQMLKLSKSECELSEDSPNIEIKITKGAGNYTVTSSNENVAVALVDGDILYIFATGMGKSTITVTDQNKNKATVQVTINEVIRKPFPDSSLVFIKKGTWKTLKYPVEADPGDYIFSEDESIATGRISGNEIIITGMKAGKTDIYLAETIWPRHIFAVTVVDVYDLLINSRDIHYISIGEETAFHIICGNGNYTIVPSEEGIVSFEKIPYTGQESGIDANPETVKIKALKTGTVELTVTDAENKTGVVIISVRQF